MSQLHTDTSPGRPIVIGIVGGIASGKSTVCRLMEKRGAAVINADQIAHRVLEEPAIRNEIVGVFGNSILNGSNEIDRSKLGKLVFGESQTAKNGRRTLESIVHPRVRELAKNQLAELSRSPVTHYVMLDVPLLIENGWLSMCDRVLFVDMLAERRQQLAQERGWSLQEWRDREAAQMPLDQKRQHATDTVINEGSESTLADQLIRLFP